MKKLIAAILSILFLLPAIAAPEKRDSIIVSLVTCWPGPEVYELCGHEALRIRTAPGASQPIDSVWNYGVFDFAQPNFVYRFVKGETDYMLAGYPFSYFMPEYLIQRRKVVEQDLNLNQDEAWKLLGLMRTEALPQNCQYRYNYVKDNCATRILDRLDQAASSRIIYPDSIKYGTFRNEMRAYHRDYPWYQFGIDLALGSGIDYPLKGREEMFAPLEMMEKAGEAHFADGRPLVRATRTLTEGVPDATLGPTHWSATPLFCSWAFLAMIIIVCLLQWKFKKIYQGVYAIWFLLCGLAGCVVTFLVFISSHEATSPNILILWLNPLQLLLGFGMLSLRKFRKLNMAMAIYNIVTLGIMLIVWPAQTQSANPAFFPLMGATGILALSYAIISSKISYKKNKRTRNEVVINVGGGRSDSVRSSRARKSGTAAARGRNRR